MSCSVFHCVAISLCVDGTNLRRVGTATPGSSPFISDIFFLLQSYQHLGLNKTLDNRDRAEKNVKEFKKDLKRLEAEKAGWQAGVSCAGFSSRQSSGLKWIGELRRLRPRKGKPCWPNSR